jgi:capsular polysaccharide biosynthesis protein
METNNIQNEAEIDLKQILGAIIDKIGLIIVVGILAGIIAFMYTKFMIDPIYQSTTQIYVRSKAETNANTYTDLQTSNILIKDYQVTITSRPVMDKVIEKLDLNMSSDSLASMVTVAGITDSRYINISVKSKDPLEAKRIVDAVRDESKEQIKAIMEIDVVTNAEGNTPTAPVSPSMSRNVAIGIILGVFVTAGIIVVRFMMDDTIKTPEDIENILGISVLSSIPIVDSSKVKKRKKLKPAMARN